MNTGTVPFDWINKNYGINAYIGQEIEFENRKGVIVRDFGNKIGVNFYEDKPNKILHLHPTWNVTYLGNGVIRPMTRSQRRYEYYRTVADCYDNFFHFLKTCTTYE